MRIHKIGFYEDIRKMFIIPPAYKVCRGVYSFHLSSVRLSMRASV